jgi:two-component system OmpR family sensor kinase
MSSLEGTQPRFGLLALVAIPLAGGLVAATIILATSPTLELRAAAALWAVVLTAGIVGSALVAVPVLIRWRIARAREAAAAEASRAATADHHRFMLRLDHELKNPVTAMQAGIANLAGMLADRGLTEEGRVIDSISLQTQRIADLVADLRKLAELETRPIDHDRVDMADLLEEVCDTAKEHAGADERTIILSLPRAPWPLSSVTGDRDLLFLAFYNLLANAIKFTKPDDTIEVRAHDDQRDVVVEVADTGIGVPSEELDQVWDELSRGRAARGTAGMGLGLAMVRAVVVRHGGTVMLRSREDHGTNVIVRLPATDPAAS